MKSFILEQVTSIEHHFGTRSAEFPQEGMSRLQQVHSALYRTVTSAGLAGEGDALITRQRGLDVSVRTADCLPILLADPASGAVAAVHAGWRGTVAGIVGATIAGMREEFGTRPEDLFAAIGPGIGVCCYQVGEDVGRKFGLEGAGHVNLAGENRRQLITAGVTASRIDVLGICTFCDSRFHSWRRDGEKAGRMVSFIRLRESR